MMTGMVRIIGHLRMKKKLSRVEKRLRMAFLIFLDYVRDYWSIKLVTSQSRCHHAVTLLPVSYVVTMQLRCYHAVTLSPVSYIVTSTVTLLPVQLHC